MQVSGSTRSGYADGAQAFVRFNGPTGIALESMHTLLVADYGGCISKVSSIVFVYSKCRSELTFEKCLQNAYVARRRLWWIYMLCILFLKS